MKTHLTILYLCITLSVSLIYSQETDSTNIYTGIDSLSALGKDVDQYVQETRDTTVVDLSGDEYLSIDEGFGTHILAKPWYMNIIISGFGGMGYLKTGAAGTRPNGGFLIKETSLFFLNRMFGVTSLFSLKFRQTALVRIVQYLLEQVRHTFIFAI